MDEEIKDLRDQLYTVQKSVDRHDVLLDEHARKLDAVQASYARLGHMESLLARIEERLEGVQQRMGVWQSLVWALIMLLLGGLVAAGFELLRR